MYQGVMNVNRKQCYFIWEGNSEKVTSIYSLDGVRKRTILADMVIK